eukprot:3315569-Pleurochrysis_carterae.AAC.1
MPPARRPRPAQANARDAHDFTHDQLYKMGNILAAQAGVTVIEVPLKQMFKYTRTRTAGTTSFQLDQTGKHPDLYASLVAQQNRLCNHTATGVNVATSLSPNASGDGLVRARRGKILLALDVTTMQVRGAMIICEFSDATMNQTLTDRLKNVPGTEGRALRRSMENGDTLMIELVCSSKAARATASGQDDNIGVTRALMLYLHRYLKPIRTGFTFMNAHCTNRRSRQMFLRYGFTAAPGGTDTRSAVYASGEAFRSETENYVKRQFRLHRSCYRTGLTAATADRVYWRC